MADILKFPDRKPAAPKHAVRQDVMPTQLVMTDELIQIMFAALTFYAGSGKGQGFDHGLQARTALDKVYCAQFED